MNRKTFCNLRLFLVLLVCFIFGGCVVNQGGIREIQRVERSVSEFEKKGTEWGRELKKDGTTPQTALNQAFIKYLNENLDYFSAHAELKDAFKRGFRIGYEDRIADLVLGPHIREAAGDVGDITSNKIVNIINDFDKGWETTLTRAIDVFIVLISEGSQADRDLFIKKFNDKYSNKYSEMLKKTSTGNQVIQVTEGGTRYIFPKELAALSMPSPDTIKTKIYSQAFWVMGDEWGRRYSTNLVRRDELVEMLRRCKPALEEGEGLDNNLNYINLAFVKSYGSDGEDMFHGIMKDSGFKDKTIEQTAKRIKR